MVVSAVLLSDKRYDPLLNNDRVSQTSRNLAEKATKVAELSEFPAATVAHWTPAGGLIMTRGLGILSLSLPKLFRFLTADL